MSTTPTLTYAAPPRFARIHLLAAILLLLWAILDLLLAPVLLLICIFILTDSQLLPLFVSITAACYAAAAIVVLYFGLLSASHAKTLCKKDLSRLPAAHRVIFFAECFAYLSTAGPIAFFLHDRGWDNTRELTGWFCGLAAYMLLPLAVTLTRFLLRKAKTTAAPS